MTTLEKPEERFQDFLRSFRAEDEHKYRKRLGHVALSGSRSIVVDFEDLIAFDPDLARSVLDKPDEYFEYLDRSAWAQLKIEDPEYAEIVKRIRVRFRKLPERHHLRKIGSENIGRLLLIDGIIVRATSVKPLLIKAAFQCRKCNAMSYVEQAGTLMRGPGVCAHCFPPDTIITGHYKPIKEYLEGESIVSGCGEITGIKKIFRREYDGPLLRIIARGLLPIETTPEHPILTVGRSYAYKKNKHGNFAFTRVFGQPRWKEAKDLEVINLRRGDYLAVPRIKGWLRLSSANLEPFTSPHGKLVARAQSIPLRFPLKEETAWLLGLYAAEGSSSPTGLRFCLGAHEKRLQRRVAGIARTLGYSPALTKNDQNEVQVHIRSRLLGRAFGVWFGRHAYEKRVPDFVLYNSQRKLARAFLRGYWDGDGCREPNLQYKASTASRTFALQLQLLAARLGIFVRISENRVPPFHIIEGRRVSQRTRYILSYHLGRSKRGRPTITRLDYIFTPVRNVQTLQYRGPVYNFETDHETYVAQNAVVHNCRSKIFEFMEKQSTFMNSQEIRIQERPEDLPPGQLPRAMDIKLSEDLVDIARPGDRVSVSGIARAQQEFAGRKARLRTFELQLDANYVDVVGKEIEVVEITPEDERQIRELAKDPFIHRKLIASLAPSIYGYGDIKEAVLYLLFSGVSKRLPDGVTIRGETNVLLVGDPGTAKSQLLQYVSRIAPRGLYTSGRGTTAAGLTAAVVREKSGGMVLEAGALVLADKGVACIDEIDKMRPDDRVAIHEALEQHTVSIAKGGIVATLNARAAVLAAANPSLGRYDPYRNITDNINLPVTLLSRFDLLFIMKDVPEPDADSRMSEHILTLHRLKATPEEPPLTPELLRKYIAYAKRIDPVLTEESVSEIRQYYMKMRSLSGSTESPVAITPRQLEALVRLGEARARSFLRDRVEGEDARSIIRLMTLSLQDVGIDTTTGKIDIDVIMTGKPKSLRDKMQVVLSTFVDLEKQLGIVEEPTLYQALSRKVDITDEEARRLVEQLVREGILYAPKPGHLKRTAA